MELQLLPYVPDLVCSVLSTWVPKIWKGKPLMCLECGFWVLRFDSFLILEVFVWFSFKNFGKTWTISVHFHFFSRKTCQILLVMCMLVGVWG
jgi:hypothetical protein